MVDILAESELVFLAMSSLRLIILETFTPAAGSNSFKVTTGPWLTFLILPSTPKSKSIFSSRALSVNFLSFSLKLFFSGSFKMSDFGILNFNVLILSFESLLNGRSSCTLEKFLLSWLL